MRSAVVAAALAGAASAAWSNGPPAYQSDTWGESSAAPVTSSEAPAYSSPAASSPAPVYSSVAPVYTTEVVTAYTTFCPKATEITHGGMTYTATEATTLTITNCPGGCTVTYPVSSPVESSPVVSTAPGIPTSYPAANTTAVWSTAAPIGSTATTSYGATGSPIASAPPATGGAAKSYSAVGAAIAAVFGLIATL